MILYYLLSIVMGYLFGCIHGSQIVGKIKKVDIKNSGVKNAGASNTTILLGWKFGIIVALIDIFKAIIPIFILRFILKDSPLDDYTYHFLLYLSGAFAIIGHNYPVTMGFKGGKGTASLVGMLLVLDWKIGLIAILSLVLITFLTDYLVIGVFVMYLLFSVLTYFFDMGFGATVVAIFLTLLSTYKHMENYKRIKDKTEKRISSMFKKKC